ncbi:MAG TPA: hypothetical protein VKU02_13720 [Gemmataceae bacterium]|nr:hypothetical protein [Gemmataceae bacterium]
MTGTISDKLVALVVEVTDVGELFGTSVFKDRIGLDVRVVQGSLAIGKKVFLSRPGEQEELEIVGIEMLRNPRDPNVVRILCSKPKRLTIASGTVEGWVITE